MAAPDLTPETLAQLEELLVGWKGAFSAAPVKNQLDGWEGQTQLVWHTSPEAASAFEDKVHLATDFNSDVAPDIATMLNAVPSLVAAARERDQLQVKLENQGHALFVAEIEHKKMQAEVGTLRAELDDVRRAVDAPGDSGTFEAVARLYDEVTRLREEVERLRGLGMEATGVLQALFEGESWTRLYESKLSNLIAEIERKP